MRGLVGNRVDGADILAQQAGDVTRPVDRNGIEGTYKSGLLGANSHARSAVDAGVPTDAEENGLLFTHIFLNSEVGLK